MVGFINVNSVVLLGALMPGVVHFPLLVDQQE